MQKHLVVAGLFAIVLMAGIAFLGGNRFGFEMSQQSSEQDHWKRGEAVAMDLDELYVQYFSLKHFLSRYETGYREQLSEVIKADEDSRLMSVAADSRALSGTSENALNQAYNDFCSTADFNKDAEELARELDDITRSFFLREIDRANAMFDEFSPGARNALRAVLHTDFELPIKAGKVGPGLNSVDSAKADPDGFKARLEAGCKYFK